MRINLRFAVIGQLVAYTPDAVTAQNLISGLQTAIRLSELFELDHAKNCVHYWYVAKLLNANICVSVDSHYCDSASQSVLADSQD